MGVVSRLFRKHDPVAAPDRAGHRGTAAPAMERRGATLLLPQLPWPDGEPLKNPRIAALQQAARLEVTAAMGSLVALRFDGVDIRLFCIATPFPQSESELRVNPLLRAGLDLAAHRAHVVATAACTPDLASRRQAAVTLSTLAAILDVTAMLWTDSGVLTAPNRLRQVASEAQQGLWPVDCWVGFAPAAGPGGRRALRSVGAAGLFGFEVVLHPRPGTEAAQLQLFYTALSWFAGMLPELEFPVAIGLPGGLQLVAEMTAGPDGQPRLDLLETAVH